jgi:amino-acid N-acetyltransferase
MQASPARPTDVPAICQLLAHYAGMGDLLPRTTVDVQKNLHHFMVIRKDQQVIACGSLEHFTAELAEIRSLMVEQGFKKQGLGRIIVQALIARANDTPTKRIMALTYVPHFFHQLGFRTVSKEIFPEKIWGICVNCYKFHKCDEIAVLLELN